MNVNSLTKETKAHVVEFENSVDLDEVANNDLPCLPSSL